MDRTQTIQILSCLKVSFPNAYKGMSKSDAEALINLWCRLFADDKYEDVLRAVDNLILNRENSWTPTVGEIKKAMGVKQTKRPIEAYPSFQQTVREFMADYALYGADCLVKDKSQLVPKLEGRAE